MGKEFREKVMRLMEAVRTFEEGDGRAPTADDVSEEVGWSIEEVHFLLHRLVDHGMLSMIPSAYDERYAIENEDLLETLPDPADEPSVGQAHQERKAKVEEQVGQIGQRFSKDFVDPEKSKLFDDVKTRLSGAGPRKANPLDAPAKPADPTVTPEKEDFFSKLSQQLSGKKEQKVNPLDALTQKKK